MLRRRLFSSLSATIIALLVFAPAALAHGGGGQGWYGETDDQVVTNTMFIVIALIPTLAIIFSLIQWRIEKRHYSHMAADKAREANLDWRGGW